MTCHVYSSITRFNYIIVGSVWPLAIFEARLENLKTSIFLQEKLITAISLGGELGYKSRDGGIYFSWSSLLFCLNFLKNHVHVLSVQKIKIETFRKKN